MNAAGEENCDEDTDDLIPRVKQVEDQLFYQGLEIAKGKQHNAADLARFEAVQQQLHTQRDEFHRDLEASEKRTRDDIHVLRDKVDTLGQGQATILSAVQGIQQRPPPPPGTSMPPHAHTAPGAESPGANSQGRNLLARVPVKLRWILGTIIAIGVGVGSVIAGFVMGFGVP